MPPLSPNAPSVVQFDTTVVIPVYFNEASISNVVGNVLQAWELSGRRAESLEFVLEVRCQT